MALTLKLRIHGVIGYVETPGEANKQVALFLPKAKRRIVPNQVAYLRYPKGTLVESDHKPAATCRDSLCHIVLKGEHLWIDENDVADTQLTILNTKDANSSTPTSKDERSIVWVPNMTKLTHDYKADIHKNYFDDPLDTDPRLIARFFVRKGSLESNGVDPVLVPFKSDGGRDADYGGFPKELRLPIARELLLTVKLRANDVIMRSKKFKSGQQSAMRFETDKPHLELCLGNESAEDIYQPTLQIQTADTLTAHCMAEFKSYYDMCFPVPSHPLMPYLSSRPGTDTCCSVARFAPREFEFEPEQETAIQSEENLPPNWTVLAYLAADNSLSTIANDDVDKLERPNAGVGVAVQVDRLDKPTERLLLEEDGFQSIGGIHGNLNSGDPQVLIDFLRFGQDRRPAKNFAAFILSHGAGLLDFSYPPKETKRPKPHRPQARNKYAVSPDATSGDFLDNQELAFALREGRKCEKFGIIGFDACVMALVEVAYEIYESGHFLIASQDEVHNHGLPYGRILRRIRNLGPRNAATTIVQQFRNASQNKPFVTLSAVALREIPPIVVALNALGEVLEPLVKDHLPALARARNRARAFSLFHYIDLRGFAEGLMIEFNSSPEVLERAQAVVTAVNAAVVCTNDNVDPDGIEQNGACGLSIYLPNSRVVKKVYERLAISKGEPPWYRFVVAYAKAPRV